MIVSEGVGRWDVKSFFAGCMAATEETVWGPMGAAARNFLLRGWKAGAGCMQAGISLLQRRVNGLGLK